MLRIELQRLYALRSALDTAIRELELAQSPAASLVSSSLETKNLEFGSKPCNLTSCRSA